MIYELRIYRCLPGRNQALLSRFENETLRICEKHGIRKAGFWTTLICAHLNSFPNRKKSPIPDAPNVPHPCG